MSDKASARVIGAFVLGGIALAAIGIVTFGGMRWLQQREVAVAFFPGSISGLRVGAPVNFRGVNVGQVTDIRVLFEQESIQARIPVVFELDPERIIEVGPGQSVEDAAFLQSLIDKGFRAQLGMESFVTGMLSVDLDFFPRAPAPEFHNSGRFELPYPEVPTMRSELEQLQANAGQIAQELTRALNNMNRIFGGITATVGENKTRIDAVIDDITNLVNGLSGAGPKVGRLLDESTATVRAARQTAEQADGMMRDNAATLTAALGELQASALAIRRMADQANNMVAENRQGLRDFSATGLYEITGLAQDAQRMADQITRVMEELERDPARFLFGDRGAGVAAD